MDLWVFFSGKLNCSWGSFYLAIVSAGSADGAKKAEWYGYEGSKYPPPSGRRWDGLMGADFGYG